MTDNMQNKAYKLRCSLPGHAKDVRSVTVGNFADLCIVSGSRDKTAKLWNPEGYLTRQFLFVTVLIDLYVS